MILYSLLCFPLVGGFLFFLPQPRPVLVFSEQFVLISEKNILITCTYMYMNMYMYMVL